ncbi:MAG: carboxypeptidase-like regulatory domain-containing protein, partial [Gemmatimonadaceae bacterium]
AQTIRGIVKSKAEGGVLDRAQILVHNEAGRQVGAASTDARGRFLLDLKMLGKPFRITVKRLGITPTYSDAITLQPSDTADLEFLVEETSTAPIDTFKVRAIPSTNERALIEAERRGWKMFTPKEVERHRDQARTLQDLLRSWGNASINFASGNAYGSCVRSTRNNKCLDWVVDGQVVGPNFNMDPRDIYFLAYVSQTDAQTQWGSKTPNGAIYIVTRMNGDKIR